MPESVLDWGIQFVLSLQLLGDWLIGPMNAFTFLGNEDFFLLLFPFLYWCVESALGIRMGIYLILSIGVNSLFKSLFHDPRPYWYDARVELLTGAEASFGLPSGHAQNSMVIWGGLATQLRRRWVWGIAIALAFLVGVSRMYLGPHFPTDVVAGWLLGILVIFLALRLEKPVVQWIKKFGGWQKVGVYFALSLAFILLNALIVQGVSQSFTIPESWAQTASADAPDDPIAPFSLSGMVTIMAAAFGFLSGLTWLETRGGFDSRGTWTARAGRFLVGIVGVMVLRYGLDFVFGMLAPVDESVLGYVLRYVRYGTIGFWMAALAPLVFIRLKLAKRLS